MLRHVYVDPCRLCGEMCNPYESDPNVATAAILYLPNVDRLDWGDRASHVIVCFSCLEKLGTSFGRNLEISYDNSKMRCMCKSFLCDPQVECSNGRRIETYIALAKFLCTWTSAFTPLNLKDFRRAIQWRLTGDWCYSWIIDFTTQSNLRWENVDFYELSERLYSIMHFERKEQPRVIVKHRLVKNERHHWSSITPEYLISSTFVVLISSELDDRTYSSQWISDHRYGGFSEIVADFHLNSSDIVRFLYDTSELERHVSLGESTVNDVRCLADANVVYEGNIGLLQLRSGGVLRYES